MKNHWTPPPSLVKLTLILDPELVPQTSSSPQPQNQLSNSPNPPTAEDPTNQAPSTSQNLSGLADTQPSRRPRMAPYNLVYSSTTQQVVSELDGLLMYFGR